MRRLTFTLLSLLIVVGVSAQTVIMEEDFTSGALPAGWTVVDVDGLTPAAQVAWATDAWVVRGAFDNAANNVVASNSWYDPAGQADDWLIIPGVSIANSGTILQWDAMAPDANFPDGYSVYVSTTGTSVSDFTSTTPIFSQNAEMSTWTNRSASLDAYVGSTINIAFRNNSNDMFVLMLDNIKVVELAPVDVAVTELTVANFVEGPAQVAITGTVTNYGATNLTAFDLTWSNGTDTETDNVTGINLPPLGTYMFSHSVSVNVNAGDNQVIEVTASASGDGNAANNSLTTEVSGLTFLPPKVVFAEEATGTWCGWCPRGAVMLDNMASSYPNAFIGIAVHNGDPMVNSTYDTWMGGLVGGYPSGVVDRVEIDVDPSQFENIHLQRKDMVPPAEVKVGSSFDAGTREVSVTVQAQFAATFSNADYRLAAIVVENGVTGTSAGYNQANYYSGGGSGAMGGYENLPDPVPAADMIYDHVGRDLLGGIDGDANSVPSSITAGDVVTKDYTITLDASYDDANIEIVGLLIDNGSGEVLNAAKTHLGENGGVGIETPSALSGLSIYPNPFTHTTNVELILTETAEVSMGVYNMLGEQVAQRNYGSLSGSQVLPFDGSNLEAGIYFINLNVDGEIITERVVLSK